MLDFAAARRMMVDGQVRTADVTEPRLIAAMADVPREPFLPGRTDLAYLDLDVPVGEGAGRRMLKPMVFAKLVQLAEIMPTDRVLDVGCGSGYSTAVLARLAGSVVGLEQDPELARQAEAALAREATPHVTVVKGELAAGAAALGPYDVIVIEGAIEVAPTALFEQLADGGRLVCVFGGPPGGRAMLYRKAGTDVSGRPMFDASAAVLPGFSSTPGFTF